MVRKKQPQVPPIVKKALQREKIKAAMDSFTNSMTGAGTDRSKLSYAYYCDAPLLDSGIIETLMKDNDLAQKVVIRPVEDALRAGFQLQRRGSTPEKDHEDAETLCKAFKKLMHDRLGDDKFKRAWVSARAHGGGGLILGAVSSTGEGMSSPLVDEDVVSLDYVIDFDRTEMIPMTWYPDGSPELYSYTPPFSPEGAPARMIHESRCIFFPGAYTSNKARVRNGHWDHSVLQAVYTVLLSFDQMFSSTDAMFNDASQSILKLSGLIKSLADAEGEGVQASQTRLQLLDMMRSASRSIFLEAGSKDGSGDPEESFEVVERGTLGTLGEVIQQYYVRLAAAADQPLTVLLGQAPSGMDATGESDMILYFNRVDIGRQRVTPGILRIITMLARVYGIGLDEDEGEDIEEGDAPEDNDWMVVWPELARPTPIDVATADNMRITSAVALIDRNVVLPEEVALSLKDLAPDLKIVVDCESREKALAEALTEVENREMTPPTEEPPTPTTGPGANAEKKTARSTTSKAAGRQT